MPMEGIKIFLKKARDFFSRYGLIVLLLLYTAFLFYFQLGSIYLFDVDEAVFSEATREMLETGDWITPHYNYSNRYDKPILFYWLMAIAYKLFGVNEFAARFWSAALGLGLVLITYLFIRSVLGHRTGLLSAFILASCLEIIGLAHSAITDMSLTFFITLALFCFFQAYRLPSVPIKKLWYWGCFAGMALAVLTKGLVGIVLPVLIIFLFLLLTGRLGEIRKEPGLVSGILLFFALSLPWYLLEFSINGREFFEAFFVKHHFKRYTDVVSGHRGPFYYFLLVILLGFFPWSAFLPASLLKAIPSDLRLLRKASRDSHIRSFAMIWFLVVLIFFSFSQTKLPNYVATFFPAMAILVGVWWEEKKATDRSMKISYLFMIFLILVIAAMFLLMPFLIGRARSIFPSIPYLTATLDFGIWPWIIALLLLIGAAAFILAMKSARKDAAFGILVTAMGLFVTTLLAGVAPVISDAIQGPFHDYALAATTRLAAHEKLIVYGFNKPSVIFYARRPAIIFIRHNPESFQNLMDLLIAKERCYIITKNSLIPELRGNPNFFILEQRAGIVLASNQPILAMQGMLSLNQEVAVIKTSGRFNE